LVYWQQKRGDGELDGVPDEALDEASDAVSGES
jgi:hypothetical protein